LVFDSRRDREGEYRKEEKMFRYHLLFVALLGVATQAHGQTKADGMFDELTYDFGSAPRGQVVTHPFRIVNNTKNPVLISSVTPSCSRCSEAKLVGGVTQMWLQPGQETAIIAKMFTNQFSGTKVITIYVRFGQGQREEVRLWMQANSRDDVTFSPDNIAFGQVKRGTTPESKITITFPGSGQTKITEIKSDSNYVAPTMKEVKGGAGETVYEITAKLRKDTPAGKWYTDVWLTTNNASMPKIRVPVTVEVEAPLSVNPSTVSLGQVKAGTESDRKVIIRGIRAFRITGITGTDKLVQVRPTDNESRMVHVLTVTLNPSEPGDLSRMIRVQTDLSTGSDIEFQAKAEVGP
jgi:hypothetical protein